jgi:ABC-type sugar transport system permease subunit
MEPKQMKRNLSFQQDQKLTAALYLAVPLVLFCMFFLYPLGYTIYLSFFKWNGLAPTMAGVGFGNYIAVMKSQEFVRAFANNARWLLYFIIVPPALGLGLALLVGRMKHGQGVLQTIFYLPYVITPIAVGAIWKWIFDPGSGLLNIALRAVGLGVLAQNWLGQPSIAIYSMMLAASWVMIGLPFVLYLAGLKTVPRYLVEAAEIDGASAFMRFRYVIFPILSPTTIVVEAFSILGAIRLFDLVYALTNGEPNIYVNVLAPSMIKTSFQVFKMGEGAAIAVILLVVTAAILCPYLAIATKRAERVKQ